MLQLKTNDRDIRQFKLKVMCPCKYSCVYTLSKYADKMLTKKRPVARCDW